MIIAMGFLFLRGLCPTAGQSQAAGVTAAYCCMHTACIGTVWRGLARFGSKCRALQRQTVWSGWRAGLVVLRALGLCEMRAFKRRARRGHLLESSPNPLRNLSEFQVFLSKLAAGLVSARDFGFFAFRSWFRCFLQHIAFSACAAMIRESGQSRRQRELLRADWLCDRVFNSGRRIGFLYFSDFFLFYFLIYQIY